MKVRLSLMGLWFISFFCLVVVMANGAKGSVSPHKAWQNAMAYALQVDFNTEFKGHYRLSDTICQWTPYKFSGMEIFVCHTKEHYLASGKIKQGYLYVLPDGEFLTADEAMASKRGLTK